MRRHLGGGEVALAVRGGCLLLLVLPTDGWQTAAKETEQRQGGERAQFVANQHMTWMERASIVLE